MTGLDASGTQTVLYSYDPQTDSWTDQKTNKIPPFTTLVNCNEKLVVVGGTDNTFVTALDAVSIYDPNTDTLTQKATLTKPGLDLKVAVHGSKILVTVKSNTDDEGNKGALFGLDLIDIDTGEVKDLTSVLPTFNMARDNHYSLASVAQGFVLCGSSAFDASTTTFDDQDTYLLDSASLDSSPVFKAVDKRASRSQLFHPSATSHRGVLYAFGISYFEEGGYVLRATDVQTLDQPGDLYSINYNSVEASEHNNPVSYSPTSLPLALSNAQNRSGEIFEGWYTSADFSSGSITELSATTTGDLELWAQWKTDTPPGPDPSSNGGTALSKAGDMLPMIVVILAVIALLSGIVLLRTGRNRAQRK